MIKSRLALADCRKLRRCGFRLPALYLALDLKPIIQVATLSSSALLVKFVEALLNLLLNRNQERGLFRLRRECWRLFLDLVRTDVTSIYAVPVHRRFELACCLAICPRVRVPTKLANDGCGDGVL